MVAAKEVVLVEGEKCAQALIQQGITATTAMNGANAPVDKTDWSPLIGKCVIVWPDKDTTGNTYADKAAKAIAAAGAKSVAILSIPNHKPEKWDAADAVQEGMDIRTFITERTQTEQTTMPAIPAFTVGHFLDDTSSMPEDLILPRVLAPGRLLWWCTQGRQK